MGLIYSVWEVRGGADLTAWGGGGADLTVWEEALFLYELPGPLLLLTSAPHFP